jgi:glyoxylase-like metal-dependent hydrolase (beta-lactamase superfamily II)
MKHYTVTEIHPWLYSIFDPLGAYCYLIVGEKEALLYDTVFGVACLREVINGITAKPVTVVLGHGHIDHVNGAHQFGEVWLHKADFALFEEHSSVRYRKSIAKRPDNIPEGFDAEAYVNAPAPRLKELNVGQVFDLGNLTAETVGMEGHTAGSVGLLIREHRVLLNSDAANGHIWMFLNESLPVGQYVAMLERTMGLAFDTFYTGHSNEPQPKAMMEKYVQVARNSSVDKAEPYNPFPDLPGFLYQEDGVGIVFSERTLGQ